MRADKRMRVDVVIPSFNTLQLLQSLLSELQTTAPGTLVVVVVDNGSTDGTVEWLAEQDFAIPIINGENLGFAKACNLGVWAGDREFVVFLNTDIELAAGWLEALLAAFDDEEVVLAGNQLVRPNGNCQRYDFIAGACCAVRRDWFIAVGGYDEQFFFGYEDVDLSWQARLEGKRIVTVAEPSLVHLGAASHTDATTVYVQEARELFRRKWDMPILKFTGGGRFLIGVPARDLSVEDLMGIQGWTMDELIATGLYRKVAPVRKRKPKVVERGSGDTLDQGKKGKRQPAGVKRGSGDTSDQGKKVKRQPVGVERGSGDISDQNKDKEVKDVRTV